MKKLAVSTLALSVLALGGCVGQNQADAKMVDGCKAGVEALIAPKTLKEIKARRYADEDVDGGLHRRITLQAVEQDGWMELDKEYSCLFMQEWGLFKSSHEALLVQLRIDDDVYGKVDGVIQGDFQDFLKLTDTVNAAMRQ